MTAISAVKARENLCQLLDKVNSNNEPVKIINSTGKNGVLIGEDVWNGIQETLNLYSIPVLAESIIEGGNTPLEECLSEDEAAW